MLESLYQEIAKALVTGDESRALRLVRQALDQGARPMDIVADGLQPGLDRLSAEYESGSCFVPELIIAGRIMQAAMRILERSSPHPWSSPGDRARVVLGTVAGDVHTIGKDLVAALLTLNGFEIIDLGFNVPPETFVNALQRERAQILAMSALLLTSRTVQRQTIVLLNSTGLRQRAKVIIGGAASSPRWAEEIGADGYARNAADAVVLCQRLLSSQAG